MNSHDPPWRRARSAEVRPCSTTGLRRHMLRIYNYIGPRVV